jgi:hypothetical protein
MRVKRGKPRITPKGRMKSADKTDKGKKEVQVTLTNHLCEISFDVPSFCAVAGRSEAIAQKLGWTPLHATLNIDSYCS